MTYPPQRPSTLTRLLQGLDRLLYAGHVITERGAGVSITEALVMVAEAVDRNTQAELATLEETRKLYNRLFPDDE